MYIVLGKFNDVVLGLLETAIQSSVKEGGVKTKKCLVAKELLLLTTNK
jgi:hypothetical protein